MSEQPNNNHKDVAAGPGEPRGADDEAARRAARLARLERPSNRVPRYLVVLGALALLLGGVALGFLGHGRIGHALGLHGHGASGNSASELWTCGMHPQVIKDAPGLCPICEMKLEPLSVVQAGGSAMTGGGKPSGAVGERKVKYWWDPMMNPPYIAQQPGKSPMGMDLVPVYEDEVSGGTAVRIDPVVVQNMGVRLAPVTRGAVHRDVRAVGYLAEAEPNVRDVNLRVSGWVERLHADTVGMALSKGAPLFDLYSPEVQVAVEELIAAKRSAGAAGPATNAGVGRSARALLDAATRKLELWGLDHDQVEKLSRLDSAPRAVTFDSPIDGYLTQKMVVQGAAVKAGDAVMRIVDLSTVWLDLQVYAQDFPFVRMGQDVTAAVEGIPGKTFSGKVVFVAPQVDAQTRTATVRVSLPNHELDLRPGMFATAQVHAEVTKDATLVPREAVIDTGTRQVVFVAGAEPGHFEPRRVKLGSDSDGGAVQVLEGVAAGETVVTSGQFLLDAESRMREAIQKHLSERLAGAGGAKPAAQTQHAAHATPTPTTTPVPTLPTGDSPASLSTEVDAAFSEYLRIQAALGVRQEKEVPVDAEALSTKARALADLATGDVKRHAAALADAAGAMRGQPLPEQRKLYKAVGDAAIALAGVSPPSRAVAPELFVAHCPMAPGEGGRWLQPTDKVANPYFATSMKACGTIERRVPLKDSPATKPAATSAHEGHGAGKVGAP